MRKKFTLLIASLAFLLGGISSYAQQGVLLPEYQEEVTPRRTDATPGSVPDYISGAANVGETQFGAGESATIINHAINLPRTGANGNTADSLNIGSTISKNIVMNNYNAGGRAAGFLNITASAPSAMAPPTFVIDNNGFFEQTPGTPAPSTTDPDIPRPTGSKQSAASTGTISPYNINFSYYDPNLYQLAGPMWCQVDIKELSAPSYINYTAHLYLSNHIPQQLYHWGVKATEKGGLPYTTTRGWLEADSVDNGTNLVEAVGDQGITLNANVGNASLPDKRYVRPTTLAVGGVNNEFGAISFHVLEWYLNAHNLETFASNSGRWYTSTVFNLQAGLVGGCGHVGTLGLTLNQIGEWEIDNIVGPNKLDAAVQLINGAKVCVQNDVMDNTGFIGSSKSNDAADAETNALIVLPVADRVTFRTKGNFQANMYHEPDSLTSSNVLYSAADFPDPDTDIYMYNGSGTENIGSPLQNFGNARYTTVTTQAPYTGTTYSVFGVNGDYLYTGNMAEIHTDIPSFSNNSKGVIEVGTMTAGKSHFHVYGNGMLKNYEDCSISTNFAMNFGDKRGSIHYGGTPEFLINTDETLYIVNFGNNGANYCDADLLFHITSVDSLGNAFAGLGAGPLQIQALSDVRLMADGTWDATARGNNIFVLSDGGNISTQKLDISNDNAGGVGHGLITFWAETDPLTDGCVTNDGSTRFSESGSIYFNDAVTLTRAASATTQTNIIAANNLRTASFSSINANDEDTTNIISRKGDIYLGYSAGSQVYNSSDALVSNNATGNGNIFSYQGTGTSGTLNILSGYDDQANNTQYGGGNIYFTRINADMTAGNTHETNIMIPFSNEYYCGSGWVTGMLHERLTNNTMQLYEHAGIIGGVGRCGIDGAFGSYGGLLENPGPVAALAVTDTGLVYRANNGNLLVDAGLRGNIIINQGTYLDFQDDTADAFFLTRSGDIDMRGQTNIDHLQGSVLFLASSEESDKLKTGICGCTEQQNNVYLQDLEQRLLTTTKGSIFIGADNNIKLQYGGLKNIGTQIDPFLSENAGYDGVSCGTSYHCDSDTSENKARDLILNFAEQNGEGGMGIVASDLIDIYKNMIYTGGNGPGMGSVPTYGTLHGEGVAGYGLYIKSQGNKNNWTKTDFDVLGKCGRDCDLEDCKDAFLHQTARVTFHADARLYPENQRAYIGSPVLDVYGNLELNTTEKKGSKTAITIQTDSLICHDSLIIDGTLTKFDTWSSLYRNMPVIKLGHQRFTPPFTEDGTVCAPCYIHNPASGSIDKRTALDSIFVTFRNSANLPRLHTLVADHAVISFLTDSFDHVKGNPVINAKFYTDTFKVRNHVELFNTADHTHDGHFELISEAQMDSKDYAGIYARHLHMEPIQPGCTDELYSQLWLQDPALDVITTSTFGGFGTIHADVHIEIEAKLAPGYASLGKEGRCYEQKAGTLKMQDLRLDKGAEIYYSVGTEVGFDGEYTDCIEVDELMIYGSVNIFVEKRLCQDYVEGCYPIIRYKTVANGETNLNNLKLGTNRIDGVPLSLDASTPGVVYLCVGENAMPPIQREINIPSINGGTITPSPGTHYVNSQGHFYFSIKFDSEPPLKVTTGRTINGEEEEVVGKKNANGEYEYVIYDIREVINLTVGPDYATSNSSIDGSTVVWSHGNTIYIRVDKEDIASIYSIAGQLVKRIELSEGSTSVPMERGVYIVTLKDGSVHKVILK